MKFRLFLVLIFGILLVVSPFVNSDEDAENENEEEDAASEVPEENDVLVLTKDNFDQVVEEREILLVEFYAPWCGHCKQLAPKYEKAAKILKTSKYPVALAKVDATEESDLAQRYSVSGYPTLKVIKNGQVTDYDGPRDEDGIVKYMEERADPSWAPPPPAVVTLGTDNFTDFVNTNDLSLVEFYAPWCGHCKQLAPEYEKAAQQLKEHNIPLAKVDATAETDLAKQYDVTGYPTMKVFRKGREFEYKGGRDKYDGIVEYMMKQVGDPAKELHMTNLNVLPKDDVAVIGFFSTETDQTYQLYQDAANRLREDYTFLFTVNKDVQKRYSANVDSIAVVLPERFHSKFESKWYFMDIKEDTKADDILEFVLKYNTPLVGHYQESNKELRYKKRPLVLFFYTVDFSFDGVKATQLWRNKILNIAKNKKYKAVTFAIADDEKMATEFKDFGFDESGEEMNVGILDDKDKKFPMPPMEEFDPEEIEEFIDSYLRGELKPRVKSQPVPKKQKGSVAVVVGKTFEKIVLDKSKDVLIELYAPWCGHCKKLDPIYKELAKKYKKDKKLVIAKMDATANDSPVEYEAAGFPTIYFAPATNKASPVKFEGGSRELKDLEEFISKHATVSMGKSLKEEL